MTTKLLNRHTLVLNRNWQAVNIATVARALVMLWNESARVVDPADYQTYDWDDWAKLQPVGDEPAVQAVRFRLRVPEVMTLTDYDRLPATKVWFSRRNIFKRDRYTCQYCGRQWRRDSGKSGGIGFDELTIDHVVPRSQGGQSRWDNCVLACLDCNARKADRTPDQAGLRLRRKPDQPVWSPLYAAQRVRYASWSKFLSEAYWSAELAE